MEQNGPKDIRPNKHCYVMRPLGWGEVGVRGFESVAGMDCPCLPISILECSQH